MAASTDRDDSRRIHRAQFSLQWLLLFVSTCAVFLGFWWRVFDALLLLVLIEAVAVLACVQVLMYNLPSVIRASIADNATRLDGTWSQRRERIEQRAKNRLRWNMLFAFVLVLVPGHLLLCGIHAYVIPLPIGLDAIGAFRPSPEDWKQSLRDDGVEHRFERWYTSPGASRATDTRMAKRLLWESWPLVVGIYAVWIGLSFLALKSILIAELRDFAANVQSRGREYELHDLASWRRTTRSTTCDSPVT